MSKLNGYKGSFVINSNAVGELISWSTQDSANLYTGTAKNDARVTGEAGEVTTKLNVEMYLDPGDTGQGSITVGATVTLMELYPAENTSGSDYYTCATGVVESIDKASPMGLATHNAVIHCNAPLVDASVA